MVSVESVRLKLKYLGKKLSNLFSKPIYIFIISIIINAVLFALFFYLITPVFQTNDDIAMMEFASGRTTGQPSEYLIYINVIIGKLLSFLYLNFPKINWYPIFFYFIHFVSLTVILYCLSLEKRNIYSISIYLLLFSFLELYLLMNLQFTTTAFIAGLGGFILLLTYLNVKGKRFYLAMAGSIVLLTISGFIRRNVFYLIMGMSACVFGLKLLERKSWKIPVILVVVMLLFGLTNLFNDYYYQKEEDWGFYHEYNKYIGKINGYPDFGYSAKNKDIYNSVGWSENDVSMFRSWFFCDLELYSIEKLDYVVSNIKVRRGITDVFKTLRRAFDNLDKKVKWFAGLFLSIAILLLSRKKNKYIFSVIFSSFIISIYLSYLGRLPDWVFSPIIIFTGFTAAFFMCTENMSKRFKIYNNIVTRLMVLIICIVLVTFTFISVSSSSKINEVKQHQLEQVIEKLADENKIYVSWGATGLSDKVIFFSTMQWKDYPHIIQLGWRIHTPYYNKTLEKYSVGNIYKAIVEREDVFVICGGAGVKRFIKFMSEHYNKSVSSSLVYEIEGFPVNVYKFR